MNNNLNSPFRAWSVFETKPKTYSHPFRLVVNFVKWLLLLFLTITFFWGMGTLFFNRWINIGQVEAYTESGEIVKTYTGGVFFEIQAGYEKALSFKRHIFHLDDQGLLREYDYYPVANISDAWFYSRSPFYVFFVLPASWLLTKIAILFNWSPIDLGSNKNLLAMILSIFCTTLLLRLITGFGSFKQQRNKSKMDGVQSQVAAIKQRYKDATSFEAKQKMQWEIMNLYKRENVNPLSGSLEAFAFAPFLFAMFVVVRNSRILKDSSTATFSFTTTLWEQVKAGNSVYFIPVSVYLLIFAFNNVILPRILVFKTKNPDVLLNKKQKGNRGAIIKWAFRLLFIVFFFIVPVGTSVYWIFSSFFEAWQKIIAFLWAKRDRQQKVLQKHKKDKPLWNLRGVGNPQTL